MEKTISDIVDEVLRDPNSRLHKSYFDSGAPDHAAVVEWFSGIVEMHLGDSSKEAFYKEVFPIVIKTGEAKNAGEETAGNMDDEIKEYSDTYDFGGDDDE